MTIVPEPAATSEKRPRRPLDEAVAKLPVAGWRCEIAGLVTIVWGVLLETVVGSAAARLHISTLTGAGLVSTVLESTIGVAVIMAATAVHLPGGWRHALGLGAFTHHDGGSIARWTGVQFAARVALLVDLAALVPSLVSNFTSNNPASIPAVAHSLPALLTFVVLGGIVAPFFEELMCRGLLLRALMRRLGLILAIAISSLLFGLGHAYEETSIQGAIVITAEMTLFGVLQCLLVRRTGRLLPAMAVHGALNTLAVLIAVTSVR